MVSDDADIYAAQSSAVGRSLKQDYRRASGARYGFQLMETDHAPPNRQHKDNMPGVGDQRRDFERAFDISTGSTFLGFEEWTKSGVHPVQNFPDLLHSTPHAFPLPPRQLVVQLKLPDSPTRNVPPARPQWIWISLEEWGPSEICVAWPAWTKPKIANNEVAVIIASFRIALSMI
jgi:hypothetical protein